jgi:bacillithiol system protein YtxJ
MNWHILDSEDQLFKIQEESYNRAVLIFKHSTRCSISSTAKSRLERKWNVSLDKNILFYYLDLLAFKNVSNRIALVFEVEHQSPQVILLKDGKAILHASHLDIDLDKVVLATKV